MGSGYITQRKIEKEDYSPFKAFVDDSLTVVTAEMLDGITNISNYAFYECRSLASVNIPSGVTSIGIYAFYQCISLASVNIPSSVTSIGNSAFSYCESLASITIPSGVTSISNYAFYQCRSLASIEISNSVTSIGEAAFYGCRVLASVTVEAVTPPTLGPNAFSNTHSNLVIYVPSESVDTYKAASGWSTYASRIQAIPST